MFPLNDLRKQIFRAARLVFLVGLTTVVFPALALAKPPSPLDPVTPAARSIANLHNTIMWIATAVFAVVCILLVYALVKFRRKSADDPEPDQNFHGSATLETIWTIVPVGILVVLMVLTWQTFQDTDPNRPTDMTIQVVGKQWLWEIKYPEHGVSTIGEMYVPVNTDVRVEVTSEDVIHSFWIPQFGGKKDAVPGYLQVTWFKAEKLGTYHGQCAEYCGLAHSKMPIEVKVVDQESFDVWINSKTPQANQQLPDESEPVAELQTE